MVDLGYFARLEMLYEQYWWWAWIRAGRTMVQIVRF